MVDHCCEFSNFIYFPKHFDQKKSDHKSRNRRPKPFPKICQPFCINLDVLILFHQEKEQKKKKYIQKVGIAQIYSINPLFPKIYNTNNYYC